MFMRNFTAKLLCKNIFVFISGINFGYFLNVIRKDINEI